MYDYLIVGAGLTGSVIAHELHKADKKVLVIDKRNHIGGNCFTEIIDSIIVHKYGAHIFHTNTKWIWDYVNSFCEFIPYTHKVKAKYNNILYDLPFNLNTYEQIYLDSSENSLNKLKSDIKTYAELIPTNLEEQALKLVGEPVYNTLIKGYTEKQWGKQCSELSPEIIKRIPLRFVANNNYFNDKYQGIPKEGYTKLFEKLLDGIEVRLNCTYTKTDSTLIATTIIHTGMIDDFYNYCFGPLEYRSLRFEHNKLNLNDFQSFPVINYTSVEVPYTRIIEHKHFINTNVNYTIITKEFPEKYSPGKEAYYPINNKTTDNLYNKYLNLSLKENIIFCGRLGSYRYLDMDKAIEAAYNLAINLLAKHS